MKFRTSILAALAAVIPAVAAGGILPAPRSVEASDAAYNGAVMITWTIVPGATSYRVLRSDSADWTQARALGVTSDTAFIDPAISNDPRQVYHYWIMAEAGSAVSPLSKADTGCIRPGTAVANHRVRPNFRRMRNLMPR